MAIVNLPGSLPNLLTFGLALDGTGLNINAANERIFSVGHCYLQGQTGSKTISAAGGGVIYIGTASGVVWADGGTSVTLGIQDVDATGFPDGAFDVSATLVPGVESFASDLLYAVTMESGTKTISHGQLIAVGALMTARAGTDSFSMNRLTQNWGFGLPYGVTGSSPAKGNLVCPFAIKFDDGTWGWIDGCPLLYNTNVAETAINYNSGSTPDEYCAAWQFPVPVKISSFGTQLANVATADTFEVILYSDPFGTPAVVETITPDPDQLISGDLQRFTLAAPYTCQANTWYAMAIRPTSANNITIYYQDLGTGFHVLKALQPFSLIRMASRTDQTGAFVETQTYHLPFFLINLSGFDGGGAGGGGSFAFAG